jgi:hypothetical protein
LQELAIALPIIIRFGPNAIYDGAVDVISFLSQNKDHCSASMITDSFPFWIALFQRIEPKELVFISSKDPRQCLAFSFLPSIPIKLLHWPSLEEFSDELHTEEEEVSCPFNTAPLPIQPLVDLDKYQIDLKATAGTPSNSMIEGSFVTPKKNDFEVPIRFQPLVESMKALGKAMISLGDLETQLKEWCGKHGVQMENASQYVSKAAEAQIVIYDKSINYVRFRNRAMASSVIEYV